MENLKNKILVTEIASATAIVSTENELLKDKLLEIGFIKNDNRLYCTIDNIKKRILLINKLIDLGAVFSSGKEWCPEELLDYYCEIGYIKNSYNVIFWTAPDKYTIIKKP